MAMSIEEAANFLRSEYGMEYKDKSVTSKVVTEWVEQGLIKATGDRNHLAIELEDLEEFAEECQWKGTPYEKGIDDQTKIKRLLEEVMELKRENMRLQEENTKYVLKLGIGDF